MKKRVEIRVIDRLSQKEFVEEVYGEKGLVFLYEGKSFLSKLLRSFIAKTLFPSRIYAYFQRKKSSRKKIFSFICRHNIEPVEFVKNVEDFSSFQDFFIRKIKPQYRPISWEKERAILPADARYLVFEKVEAADEFYVKGEKFQIGKFLQDDLWAKKYEKGSMVIARLCPSDYHRFHFPFDCIPSETKRINGALFSVNPIALKRSVAIFWENKRYLTPIRSPVFGTVLFIEVGATCVGKVHNDFTSYKEYKKGEEKGFFDLGASCIVMLFEEGKILFDADLLEASKRKIEMRGLFGQSLGRAFS